MLSARVAAVLARSLPRQAGLVSAPLSLVGREEGGELPPSWDRGDIEGPRPSAARAPAEGLLGVSGGMEGG